MPVAIGEQYRLFAAHCIGIAQETPEPDRKLALLDMAQAWIALAEQAEKNSGLTILSKPAALEPKHL
jgi:hypothetical protein